MKKFLLSFVLIIAFAFYVMLSSGRTNGQPLATITDQTPTTSVIPIVSPTPSPTTIKPSEDIASGSDEDSEDDAPKTPVTKPTPKVTVSTPSIKPKTVVAPAPTPVSVAVNSGLYKNGSYTGPVTDAYYGNMQVVATISGGRLSDVTFLQYPSDRRTSQQINSRATPILRSEAIAAQSAKVNIVSGATQTSQAFVQSLSSALALATN